MSAELSVGGLQPFTSIDYPGALAAVVFVQGCPWRCLYCHNPQLQPRERPAATQAEVPHWPALLQWLHGRRGLLDAVVFSGGEPTIDPGLPDAIDAVRGLGLRVGLHTAGLSPRRLRELLPRLDWVGLDVKAPLSDARLHDRITGMKRSGTAPVNRRRLHRGGAQAVRESLDELLASGVDFECRTTAHPGLLSPGALVHLAKELAQAGVRRYALQIARPAGALAHAPRPPLDYPGEAALAEVRALLPEFTVRRDGAAA